MRLFDISLITIAIATFSFSCSNDSNNTTPTNSTASGDSLIIQDNTELLGEDEFTDEIQEFGIIQKIEDSGYPRYVITVKFPERQFSEEYHFNVEQSPLNASDLDELIGKYATIYYTSELVPDLRDIHYQQKSILGEDAPEKLDQFKSVSDTLGNAETPTKSDLPGYFALTTADGETVKFEYYITEELVNVNGQEVTTYYNERGIQTIHNIVVSSED